MPPSNTPTQPTSNSNAPIGPSGTPGQPASSLPPTSGKPKWALIVALVVALIVVVGAAAYFLMKPNNQSSANNNNQSTNPSSTTTSLSTTNSPNQANGTVSFTHPASWKVAEETNQYGTEITTITTPLGNVVEMYRSDSVGGSCEDDANTYTLVKKITTQNAEYVFTEYQVPASWGTQALRLETSYDMKTATHRALAEGQSSTNVCGNLFGYSIAKDIQVNVKNSSGKEATYNDIKNDAELITMLQSFKVTDN